MLKICPVCKLIGPGDVCVCPACCNRGHWYRMIGEDLKDSSGQYIHYGFDWTIAHWERSWKEYFKFDGVCPEVKRLQDARVILTQFIKDNQHVWGRGQAMREAVDNYNRNL